MENILENNRAQPRPSKQTVTQILRFIRDVTGKSNHKTAVKQKKAQLSCSSHGTAHEFSQRYPAAPASHHAVLAETRVHPAPTLHLRNSRTTPHGCSTPRPLTAPQAHSSAPRIEHPRRACFASRRFRRNADASCSRTASLQFPHNAAHLFHAPPPPGSASALVCAAD